MKHQVFRLISKNLSISEDFLMKLSEEGLLNPTAIRNSYISIKYKELRAQLIERDIAIQIINEEFEYISYETIESILGHPKRNGKKNI